LRDSEGVKFGERDVRVVSRVYGGGVEDEMSENADHNGDDDKDEAGCQRSHYVYNCKRSGFTLGVEFKYFNG
jgi:hypothetical protein